MILHISHKTVYQYTEEVFLEPHHLYFYPSHRPHIRILDFDLLVDPLPNGKSLRLDAENNQYLQCWFGSKHRSLEVQLEMEIAISAFNPYDFIIETSNDKSSTLLPYLQHETLDHEMINWLDTIISSLNAPNILNKITAVNTAIKDQWRHHIRKSHGILSVSECFQKRAGSCRDLAVLLIHFIRNLGIPARFVSGYAYNPKLEIGHELHAWVEFYLPGPGWIGIDPSSGLLVNDHYVPIATSHLPENTLPIKGSYRGKAQSILDYEVHINEL